MIDLTEYSDQELSLNVMNDESLYHEMVRAARRNDFSMLESLVDELFIYTSDQLAELESDFESEVEELEALEG